MNLEQAEQLVRDTAESSAIMEWGVPRRLQAISKILTAMLDDLRGVPVESTSEPDELHT